MGNRTERLQASLSNSVKEQGLYLRVELGGIDSYGR